MCANSTSKRDEELAFKNTALKIMLPVITFKVSTKKKICAYAYVGIQMCSLRSFKTNLAYCLQYGNNNVWGGHSSSSVHQNELTENTGVKAGGDDFF